MAFASASPAPRAVFDAEIMLEQDADQGRSRSRQSRSCNCRGGYRNGAHAGVAVCAKSESGQSVCYPTGGDGQCSDDTMSLCSAPEVDVQAVHR